MVRKIGEVLETDEYLAFTFKRENREVNRRKVEKLKKQLVKDGRQISPIIVNGRYEIYDGQHRFTALKELGWTIKYYTDEQLSTNDIKVLNISQNRWNIRDYVHAGQYNNESSAKMERLCQKYLKTLNFRSLCTALKDTQGFECEVKNGDYIITDLEYQNAIKKLDWLCDIVENLREIPQRRTFEVAMLKCYTIPRIDIDRLAQKVKRDIVLYPYGNMKQCIQAIQEIYNKRLPEDQKIYFEMELNRR